LSFDGKSIAATGILLTAINFKLLKGQTGAHLAGRYMRKFWHPVQRADDTKPGWAKPLPIFIERRLHALSRRRRQTAGGRVSLSAKADGRETRPAQNCRRSLPVTTLGAKLAPTNRNAAARLRRALSNAGWLLARVNFVIDVTSTIKKMLKNHARQ
jgi:hypothetical protein